MVTVTTMSESRHSAPETEADGEPVAEPSGLGEAVALRVGRAVGLGLTAVVGADDPPGEISHQSRPRTTSTPRITTIRRRQYTLAGSGPTGFSNELMRPR